MKRYMDYKISVDVYGLESIFCHWDIFPIFRFQKVLCYLFYGVTVKSQNERFLFSAYAF